MEISKRIGQFLQSDVFAVAGASTDRSKYGNKLVRCYQMNGRAVIPINPKEAVVEGIAAVSSVAQLPDGVKSLSIVTPPQITEKVVAEAIANGIGNIWMQPGAESLAAVEMCEKNGINVIADGSCLLVVLGYREH